MKKITVSDYTLRFLTEDTSSKLSFKDKTNIAKRLDSLGADAIELAALKNSKEDAVISRTIAASVRDCAVKIPVGYSEESIDEAYESIKDAKNPCLQVIMPVSTVQMEYQLHMKAPKVREFTEKLIGKAVEKCASVEFVAADASRADSEFLAEICKAASDCGASSVTICDDAGIFLPDDIASAVSTVKAACKAAVGVQVSDVIGMAAACVISAVKAGADIVKTSVSGFSAEKMADIIRMKGDDIGITCNLSATEIHRGIAEVEKEAGFAQTFSEENDSDVDISLGSDSSMSDVVKAAAALGYELSDEDNGKIYEELMRVAEKRKTIGAKELEAIIASSAMQAPSTYHLDSYVSNSGNVITATAHVTLVRDGEKISGVSIGDGPIDAAFLAIEQIVGHHYELDDFQIQSVTEGHEAVGSALVRLRSDGRLYSGNGISTDIIGASIRAYLNALNKIIYEENR